MKKLPLKLKEIDSADVLVQCKTYLKKLAGHSLPRNWQDLLALKTVRNAIIHNGGYLRSDKEVSQLAPYENLRVLQDKRLDLSIEFCQRMFRGAKQCVEELISRSKEELRS